MRHPSLKALLIPIVVSAACADRDLFAPLPEGVAPPAATVQPGSAPPAPFFWLPPMVKAAGPFSGTFDPTRKPVVRIVCTGATGPACPQVVRLDEFSPNAEKVSVDLLEAAYRTLWQAPMSLEPGDGKYRLEVSEGQALLGQADLWVVSTQQETGLLPAGRIAVVRGSPFLIKFRIEYATQASQLPGAPTDPAVGAIPFEVSPPTGQNLTAGYPGLGTKRVSVNDATVRVSPAATVAGINAVLLEFNARIIGGIPGVPGQSPGLLVLRFATASHAELAAILTALRQRPGILGAVPDIELGTDVASLTTGNTAATWEWSTLTQGGNWGLKLMNVPLLWNLNDAVRRYGGRTETGVFDSGFYPHADLTYFENLSPTLTTDHGTHVAGIIGATFGDGRGIDGVNPFADLRVQSPGDPAANTGTWANSITVFASRVRTYTSERVINVSMGYVWADANVDAANTPAAQNFADGHGQDLKSSLQWLAWLGRPLPVIVASAGNDSNQQGWGVQPARFNSPWANAALDHDVAAIIVVEAIDNAPLARASFSHDGGHLSAPGVGVLSTVSANGYAAENGTSMAAPHIAGLVSYLYSLGPALPRPTMSANPILDLLKLHGQAVPSSSAPYVNAFDAALDVDRVTGSDNALRGLLDIDDGSADGNLRVDAFGNAVTAEDMDGDQMRGDGRIDMSDFRRFRDALLAEEEANGLLGGATLALDGAADHPKRDLNGDGTVQPGLEGVMWPRMDFNGDGQLTRQGTRAVPGALGGQVLTDLQVLQSRFDDPHYTAAQLPALLESADVTVDVTQCIARAGADASLTRIRARVIGTTTTAQERLVSVNDPVQVLTLPVAPSGYNINVVILKSDGVTPLTFDNVAAAAGLGEDSRPAIDCAVTVAVSPSSATVAPGGTKQFSAVVLGAANTAVTWTATGGTISSTGLYTAGNTTGTYTVRATSVADPSVSATASVIISGGTTQPPPPQVSFQIVSGFSGGKPVTPIRYRSRVVSLPGVTVQWTFSAGGNGSGWMPVGPVSGVSFDPEPPVQVDPYTVDWFAEVEYPSTWLTSQPGVTISLTACYFQSNGQPLISAITGNPICLSVVSNF